MPEPGEAEGGMLVEAVAVGVCGTDAEIVAGEYGWAPPGEERLILGHESLGRVIDPGRSGLSAGDLVVGIVRRPDPVPCPSCAVGEWDMCHNGRYTERGIKERHGFMSERWRIEPEYAMPVDRGLGVLGALLEPASVVAKAWEVAIAVGGRVFWEPHRVLVTGAGPIGLLAALIGVQRGLEVHVLDRVDSGPKPDLVRALGAHYHVGEVRDLDADPDVIIECTGVGTVVAQAMAKVAPGGVVCLTGVGPGGKHISLPLADLATEIVLHNNAVIGSVNANRRHFYKAAKSLAAADRDWLAGLISRRVPPDRVGEALRRGPDDIKVLVEFSGA
jgi:threonine dehydrogenase-like Zn-dependent dehydrogenase